MKDIKITTIENNATDLKFQDGDFQLGDSLEQDIALNLKYGQGQCKTNLHLGCNIDKLLDGIFTQQTKSYIMNKLKMDNIPVKDVTYIDKQLKIIL